MCKRPGTEHPLRFLKGFFILLCVLNLDLTYIVQI